MHWQAREAYFLNKQTDKSSVIAMREVWKPLKTPSDSIQLLWNWQWFKTMMPPEELRGCWVSPHCLQWINIIWTFKKAASAVVLDVMRLHYNLIITTLRNGVTLYTIWGIKPFCNDQSQLACSFRLWKEKIFESVLFRVPIILGLLNIFLVYFWVCSHNNSIDLSEFWNCLMSNSISCFLFQGKRVTLLAGITLPGMHSLKAVNWCRLEGCCLNILQAGKQLMLDKR